MKVDEAIEHLRKLSDQGLGDLPLHVREERIVITNILSFDTHESSTCVVIKTDLN